MYPRLAVDRAFTLAGAGLIVTGTLVSGRIAVEDRLVLSPRGLDVRVRGLHAHNKPAGEVLAGQRVALNLTGPRLSKDVVTRGDWVLHPDIHAPTASLDVRCVLLPDAARPLRLDTEVHLHMGAAHTMVRVSLLDSDRLEPGTTGLVRLIPRQPAGALAGDRFVLRDTVTIGGGSVLDPFPPHRGRRTPSRLKQLGALDEPDTAQALRGLLAVAPGWTERNLFMRARNVLVPDRDGLLARVPAVAAGGLVFAPSAFETLRSAILGALAAFHRRSPELPGLQPERLRLALTERLPVAAFAGVLAALAQAGAIEADGPWFRLPGHRIALSTQDDRLWHLVRPLLAADRFRPPALRDIASTVTMPEAAVRVTLKRLVRIGQVVEVAPDCVFLRGAVADMAEIAADVAAGQGGLTAATFRDRLGNGRKIAILVLEFFDKAGLTVRVGDTRRVRMDRLGLFGPPGRD